MNPVTHFLKRSILNPIYDDHRETSFQPLVTGAARRSNVSLFLSLSLPPNTLLDALEPTAFRPCSFNRPRIDIIVWQTVCSTFNTLEVLVKIKVELCYYYLYKKNKHLQCVFSLYMNADNLNLVTHWFVARKCHEYLLLHRREWWGSRTLKLALRLWHLTNNHLVKYNNGTDFLVFSVHCYRFSL